MAEVCDRDWPDAPGQVSALARGRGIGPDHGLEGAAPST